MLILGIETSCDETSAAILETKSGKVKILSNVVSSQIKLHSKFGGVVPSLAAREHNKNLVKVLKKALAGRSFSKIDLIAVTAGPGLVSSLLVGTAFAKALAWKFEKPIIGVNHMEGHILSNFLGPANKSIPIPDKKEVFPALNLIVSGGHTQLVLMKDFGKYRLLGETRDDAAGEAFDKIARILGLGYPGGPAIAKEAERATSGKQKVVGLPRPMINSKNYEFSFAGLKTAVLYLVRDILIKRKVKKLNGQTVADIAAAAQEAIVDVLVSKTLRAAKEYKIKSVMLSGGVSANKLLRQRLAEAVEKSGRGLKLFVPEMSYTTDNAAMIAIAGYFNKARAGKWQKVKAEANWGIV